MGRRKTKESKPDFKYKIGEKVIYAGILYEEYTGKECIVETRARRRNGTDERYRITFLDGESISTPVSTLDKRRNNIERDFS